MKVTREEERILEEMHRLFSILVTLEGELSEETRNKMFKLHEENFSVNHCVRWGEIGISEIRDDLE